LLTGADAKLLGAGELYELPLNPPGEDWPYVELPVENPVVAIVAFVVPPKLELAGPGGLLVAAICGNSPVSIISSSSILGMLFFLY
jgi:hypothetical protein